MNTPASRLKGLIELCGLNVDQDLWFLGLPEALFEEAVSRPNFIAKKVERLLRDLYQHMYSAVEREVVEIRGEEITKLRVIMFPDGADLEVRKYGWPSVSVYRRVLAMIVARTGVEIIPAEFGGRAVTPIDSLPAVTMLHKAGEVANENCL